MKRRDLLTILPLAAALIACGASSSETTPKPMKPEPPPAPVAKPTPPAPKPKPEPAAPTLRLPDNAAPIEYVVSLDLDPKKDTFTGRVKINFTVSAQSEHLWLNATDIEVTAAHLVSGPKREPLTQLKNRNEDFIGFALPRPMAAGTSAWIDVEYQGKIRKKAFSGIFKQEHDKRWYIYTQFESLGARRAFPCFDEPRFKVPWQLSIKVPSKTLAFSNTPSPGVSATKTHTTYTFDKTKPLPSYLIAFAAGEFDVVSGGTAGRNKVPVRVITPKGLSGQTGYAVEATPRIIAALEDYFDSPYPYAKIDSIALPTFFGAMENPGLITYNKNILLGEKSKKKGKKKSRYSNERVYMAVGAHELAHQWFGNLVTLEWWNDIWLNEAFATWMAAKVVMKLEPTWRSELSAIGRRDSAMGADSLISARRVRQPIKDKGDIGAAFDGITYQKGAAVLWMFEQSIGSEAFRAGVRKYMKKYAWKTATGKDFLAEISPDESVRAAFSTFLDQPGIPLLEATINCSVKGKPTIDLVQERFLPTGSKGDRKMTWHVPVCLKYDAGRKPGRVCQTLTKTKTSIPLAAKRCPRWVMGNAGAAGYYRVAYADESTYARLFGRARRSLDIAERMTVISDMGALTATGKLGVGKALALVPTFVKDRDPNVLGTTVNVVRGVNANVLPDKLMRNYGRFVRRTFGRKARRLGWKPRKGESKQTEKLRSAVVPLVAEYDPALGKRAAAMGKAWLTKGTEVPEGMLGPILAITALRGGADAWMLLAKKLETTKKHRPRRAILGAMGSTRVKKGLEGNLELFLKGKIGMRESLAVMLTPLAHPESRAIMLPLIIENWKAIAAKIPVFARDRMLGLAGAVCSKKEIEMVKAELGKKAKGISGGDRALAQALERAELCVAYRDAQRPSLTKFLKRY